MPDVRPAVSLIRDKYYIDKTKMLEKGIAQFPSIYIEGAAGCGKSAAVRVLLANHPEVEAEVFRMEEEAGDPEGFRIRLDRLAERMWNLEGKGVLWAVLDNLPAEPDGGCAEAAARLIRHMPDNCRVLITGREQPGPELLRLLWERQMDCVPQEALLFTKEELRKLAEMTGTLQYTEEVYRETGGWAGCADLMLRLIKQRAENGLEELRPEELRKRHEVRSYIEREIIGSLSEEEQNMLRCGVLCPWVDEELCGEVWGMSGSGRLLEQMERKGFFRRDRRKEIWVIAPLFRNILQDPELRTEADGGGRYQHQSGSGPVYPYPDMEPERFWTALAGWYEKRGFIREAFACLKKSGSGSERRAFLIRNYDRVPFLEISFSEAAEWKENTPEICYLRGVYCYSRQDFLGLEKKIGRLLAIKQVDHEKKRREVYLNLLYLNPFCSLEEWISALERLDLDENEEQYHLYGVIGSSCTFLCGIRDLAGLFVGSRREINRKAALWKRKLGDREWVYYRLARIDYALETDRRSGLSEEDLALLQEEGPEEDWQIRLARMYLLCKLQAFEKSEERGQQIARLKEGLLREEVSLCVRNTEAAGSLYTVWYGEMDELVRWLRSSSVEESEKVKFKSYLLLFAQAKGFLLLNQYKKAEQKLDRAIECLRSYKWNRFLAEALFQKAILRWTDGERSAAVRYVVESFLVSQRERYVGMYCAYGKKGREVLEAYVEWMQRNAADGWHRKKKYNYGNIQRMPQADYLDVLLRHTKKNLKTVKHSPIGEAWRDDVIEKLTLTEINVLQNIGLGMSNSQICLEMNMKLPTVKSHLYSLYKKLGVNSRMQAVIKGKELGVLR